MKCTWHTCENELAGKASKFCSIKCKNKYHVTKSRRERKKKLVAHFGGKCTRCGYSKSVVALQFHHPDPNKDFGISDRGVTKSYAKLLAEAEKCVLLCANCHAEEHETIGV